MGHLPGVVVLEHEHEFTAWREGASARARVDRGPVLASRSLGLRKRAE